MSPRVSLCTITRNRPKLLDLLSWCIREQGYPLELIEWVIVDDSDSGQVTDLAKIRETDVSVKHIKLPKRLPIGSKRNLCHDLASSDLLVVLDDDDYYPPSRVAEAVAALEECDVLVAGCDRLPLLLLPDGRAWMTPPFGIGHATANTLAYRRAYLELGNQFDPEATEAEEASFLNQFSTPIRQLNPRRTVTWIGHGGNTVDKRLWMARIGESRFEKLEPTDSAFPPQGFMNDYCKALGLEKRASDSDKTSHLTSDTVSSWRIAVITPYHKESLQLLSRCHESVLAQDLPCTHVLVADGIGYPEVDDWNCRHIRLGVGHDDNGNTPRALGALAAMNEGFDCIAFLDADNWFSTDHLSRGIATQTATGCDVVFSDRHIVFPDGQRLTEQPLEDRDRRHADTSCILIFSAAFRSLALWAEMPRLLAPQCDRVMFSHLMATQRCAWSSTATVYFETWYANHFLAAGFIPPLNAKFLERYPAQAWAKAAESFRQRSHTPIYPGSDGIGPDKPRIQLVSILGPHRSGGSLLQYTLCQYLGFHGIQEHHTLYYLVAHAGNDHRARHSGSNVKEWIREGTPDNPDIKPYEWLAHSGEVALRNEQGYTILEAYFRVVQSLVPTSAMSFAKAYGQVTVLDRSCTHALVADVLFSCLPEHRAVLVVRDPIDQIASVLSMQEQYPKDWGSRETEHNLENLCRSYLRCLAIPLATAPLGQLKLILFSELLANPRAVIEETCRFLGLSPNTIVALERDEENTRHTTNTTYSEDYNQKIKQLRQQITREKEPWKLSRFKNSPDEQASSEKHISPADLPVWLNTLLRPVQQVIKELGGEEIEKSSRHLIYNLHEIPDWEELQMLVESVVTGLNRHFASHKSTKA